MPNRHIAFYLSLINFFLLTFSQNVGFTIITVLAFGCAESRTQVSHSEDFNPELLFHSEPKRLQLCQAQPRVCLDNVCIGWESGRNDFGR